MSIEKIQVAVGSTRHPKLNAVWEALSVIGPTLDGNALYDVVGVEVETGVGHTPMSRAETMAGARNRAESLVRIGRERNERWRYFVGLEGGLDIVYAEPDVSLEPGGHDFSRAATPAPQPTGASAPAGRRMVFLQNWAYVTDGTRGAFGQSGAILLPDALATRVVDDGVELAAAIDAFAGQCGIRNQQGAWGVLSRNLITRTDSFRTAVINAFAPFFNAKLYDQS